jgi:hypothetical protein
MSLMTLSVQHGHTFDEARTRLETAVHEVTSRFGTLVQRVEWSTDRSQVRLEGIGCWIEMQVDAQAVHVSADIPVLGRLLSGSVTTRLKEIASAPFSTSCLEVPGNLRRCDRNLLGSHCISPCRRASLVSQHRRADHRRGQQPLKRKRRGDAKCGWHYCTCRRCGAHLRLSRCRSKEAPCCLSAVGFIPAPTRTGQAVE